MSTKMQVVVILCLWGWIGASAQKRPVTVADCVTVRYPVVDQPGDGIVLSKDGNEVAYLVKVPVIETNSNQIQLFVKPIYENTPPILVVTGQQLSALRWVDQDHIDALMSIDGKVSVASIDVRHHSYESVAHADQDITDYSIDSTGRTIVYAVSLVTRGAVDRQHSALENRIGYYVDLQGEDSKIWASDSAQRALYIQHKEDLRGRWSTSKMLPLHDPFSKELLNSFFQSWSSFLSLSPDGNWLLFRMGITTNLPPSWTSNSVVKRFASIGGTPMVTVLYNVNTGQETVPIPALFSQGVPMWSQDSRSFLLDSPAPIGSSWEQIDNAAGRETIGRPDLFLVNVQSGSVEEVLTDVQHGGPALWWNRDGTIIVRTALDEITGLDRDGGTWHKAWSRKMPLDKVVYPIVGDGRSFVGFHDETTVPPELFIDTLGKSLSTVELNPQLEDVQFAEVRPISWETANGWTVDGYLFMPPGYVPGHRYPLVIQTKPTQGWFACDSGWNHSPEFLPQPMASAGMIYLMRSFPNPAEAERDQYPKGYAGGIGEVIWDMGVWKSAISKLTDDGLIDPSKIGIIGFSRTGWEVEFYLAHSGLPFAAATATDNVQYSVGEYWLEHGKQAAQSVDAMYGGSPYGPAFQDWLKYSVSFNLAKIHTPLLMSEMGHGVHDDVDGAVPIGLAQAYEVATGLSRLNRPVQLYYYPDEVHQPDHPAPRLANLQRSLDWYKFWLQGDERPNPEDPDQYKRWEHLRELRDADEKAVQMQSNTAKPNQH